MLTQTLVRNDVHWKAERIPYVDLPRLDLERRDIDVHKRKRSGKPHNPMVTRREAVKLILIGGVVLGLTAVGLDEWLSSGGGSQTSSQTSPTVQQTSFQLSALQQAKANASLRQPYIDLKIGTLDTAVYYKSDLKILNKLLYDPNDDSVRQAMSEQLTGKVDASELQGLIDSGVTGYRDTSRNPDADASTIPNDIQKFLGRGFASSVGFDPSFFESSLVNLDADAQSIGYHELRHVLQFNEGIKVQSLPAITYLDISGTAPVVDPAFALSMLEWQATYRQLEVAFTKYFNQGQNPYSTIMLAQIDENYNRYQTGLSNEVQIFQGANLYDALAEDQIGINVQKVSPLKYIMSSNLGGVQQTITITGNPRP